MREPTIFDTHTHYDDEKFQEDREQVLTDLCEAGVGAVMNVGASLENCRNSLQLAHRYPFVYAAVGLHPDEVGSLGPDTLAWLSQAAEDERVRAIGEIGLDYHWNVEPPEIQQKSFVLQMELAQEKNLPILVHSREAAKDTINLIKTHGEQGSGHRKKGIIHAYSGSVEMAEQYVEMGYLLGIGGVVTFKNGKKLKEVVREMPLGALVLETDCPYLAPEPHRGTRNDSRNLKYVVQTIGELKGITEEEVIRQTEHNARALFGLEGERK